MPSGFYKREKRIKPPYKCNVCKELLTNNNWYKCSKKNRLFICKRCHNIRVNNWERTHPIETQRLAISWSRKHKLTTWRKGEQVFMSGNKRDYPKDSKCELCGTKTLKRLSYHHWDDKDLSKGMWLDFKCHMFAEVVDKLGIGILNIYYLLKNKIEKEKEEEK